MFWSLFAGAFIAGLASKLVEKSMSRFPKFVEKSMLRFPKFVCPLCGYETREPYAVENSYCDKCHIIHQGQNANL